MIKMLFMIVTNIARDTCRNYSRNAIFFLIFNFPGTTDLSHTWTVYLLFHMHFTQVLHTISISLTVTLAVWRYIAIK